MITGGAVLLPSHRKTIHSPISEGSVIIYNPITLEYTVGMVILARKTRMDCLRIYTAC